MNRILPVITSQHNAWVKSVLRLHQTAERRERNRFLIEGSHLVEEAIANDWPLESICYEAEWAESHADLLRRVATDPNRLGLVLQPASQDILKRLSSTATQLPVLAVAMQYELPMKQSGDGSLALALESLQDPGNLGSMIRIAAAGNVNEIYLSEDSVSPTNPKVLRASAGQWFRSPPTVTDLPQLIQHKQAESWQVLATCAEGKSFWETDLTVPTLLLFGNEGNGLSPEMQSMATGKISVPMALNVESLNVSIAAALIVFESLRQRQVKR
jgi:RNA methyltransferase, TrmH family